MYEHAVLIDLIVYLPTYLRTCSLIYLFAYICACLNMLCLLQTLEGVMQYFVETEPMQLARLVIAATNKLTSFTKKITNATGKSKSVKNGIFQKQSSSSVVIMPDTSASSFLRNKTEFTLDKFMNLRSNSHSSGFLGRKSVTGGARKSTTVAGGRIVFMKQ